MAKLTIQEALRQRMVNPRGELRTPDGTGKGILNGGRGLGPGQGRMDGTGLQQAMQAIVQNKGEAQDPTLMEQEVDQVALAITVIVDILQDLALRVEAIERVIQQIVPPQVADQILTQMIPEQPAGNQPTTAPTTENTTENTTETPTATAPETETE